MEFEKIVPSRTTMIVVDMQNDFVAPGAAMETPAVGRACRAWSNLGTSL
jgi:nicotinamidase-related amidase